MKQLKLKDFGLFLPGDNISEDYYKLSEPKSSK